MPNKIPLTEQFEEISPKEGDVDLYQKRKKIYQRQIKGWYQLIRISTMWGTIGIYLLLPWMQWEGRQAVLFNLSAQKFHIFEFTFWPQDFILLSWALIIAAFALFFFTNLAGRLYCGYTCPQTVWTGFFTWFESIAEGNRLQRMKLDQAPWSVNKVVRKSVKHSMWVALALVTAITFVGYFTPIQDLVTRFVFIALGPWEMFWIGFFTVATYLNAGWLREQVCQYMCPYARFQSVMFDKDTLVISYDQERGEPRGSRKRVANPEEIGLGDCINCQLCVQVCPTGIDIRDGLQYECIGCAACIDACNGIMKHMDYPAGLVRYTTEHALGHQRVKVFRPRLLAYGSVLIMMVAAFFYTIINRTPLELDILRERDRLYQETNLGLVENIYTLKILNMAESIQIYEIQVQGLAGLEYFGPKNFTVAAGEIATLPVRLQIDPALLKQQTNTVSFHLNSLTDPAIQTVEESRFIGPVYKR